MRLVGFVAFALLAASPVLAQPDAPAPAPAEKPAVPDDVRFVILQLEALERARAEREAVPVVEAPNPRLQRTTTSGSRLKRDPGQGVSNVRVSRGCPSNACTSTY